MNRQLNSKKGSFFALLEPQSSFCILRLVETIVSVDVMKTMPIHFWLDHEIALSKIEASDYLKNSLLKQKKRIIIFFYKQTEMMYQVLFGDCKGGIDYGDVHSVSSPYAIIHDPDPTDESVEYLVLAPLLVHLEYN